MVTEIGIVAGEIWHFLDKEGDSELSKLLDNIDCSRDIALMSLGWLAREGHVVLKNKADSYNITLRKE